MEQALRGGISDPRNPNIFKMFLLIGVGERAGSGLGNIQLAWKQQNWRKPQLIEIFQPDRIELILRTTSLLPQDSIDMLRTVLKDSYLRLSKDEIMALVTAHQEGQVTNSRLQVLSEKHSTETGKVLSSLVDKGLLIPDGQRRGTKYLLSEFLNGNSVNNEGDSVNNEEISPIDEETMGKLKNISREARETKRVSDINVMKEIILKLCEIIIIFLLGRRLKYLVKLLPNYLDV